MGWGGEWGCNFCGGRTLSQSDPRIRDAEAMQPALPIRWAANAHVRFVARHMQVGTHTTTCVPEPRRMEHCQHNFFSARENTATNSLPYCPIQLHAAGLLHQDCAMGWCHAVPGFKRRAGASAANYMMSVILPKLLRNCWRSVCPTPPGSRLRFRCIMPSIIDEHGHVPNLLQDLVSWTRPGPEFDTKAASRVYFSRCNCRTHARQSTRRACDGGNRGST